MQDLQANKFPHWFLSFRMLVDYITSVLNIVGTLLIVGVMILVNSDVIDRRAKPLSCKRDNAFSRRLTPHFFEQEINLFLLGPKTGGRIFDNVCSILDG